MCFSDFFCHSQRFLECIQIFYGSEKDCLLWNLLVKMKNKNVKNLIANLNFNLKFPSKVCTFSRSSLNILIFAFSLLLKYLFKCEFKIPTYCQAPSVGVLGTHGKGLCWIYLKCLQYLVWKRKTSNNQSKQRC